MKSNYGNLVQLLHLNVVEPIPSGGEMTEAVSRYLRQEIYKQPWLTRTKNQKNQNAWKLKIVKTVMKSYSKQNGEGFK